MYKCSNCGETFPFPVDRCPRCRAILSGVHCENCNYTGGKTEFIENNNRCPKCNSVASIAPAPKPPKPPKPKKPPGRADAIFVLVLSIMGACLEVVCAIAGLPGFGCWSASLFALFPFKIARKGDCESTRKIARIALLICIAIAMTDLALVLIAAAAAP
jgi:hypothetical protein